MKKIFFALTLLLLSFFDIQAQQDPHYTQYMYNMNVVNPAYAGSKENLSGSLLYRQQCQGPSLLGQKEALSQQVL